MTAHPIDYDALRELADRATPGPWEADTERYMGSAVAAPGGSPITWDESEGEVFTVPDAEFIAAARTALPALLDETTALRARIDVLRDQIGTEVRSRDEWESNTEDAEHRATRAEAERDEWRQTAQEERGATLDLIEVVKERDRRIEAVRGLMNHHDKFGNVPIEDLLRALNT